MTALRKKTLFLSGTALVAATFLIPQPVYAAGEFVSGNSLALPAFKNGTVLDSGSDWTTIGNDLRVDGSGTLVVKANIGSPSASPGAIVANGENLTLTLDVTHQDFTVTRRITKDSFNALNLVFDGTNLTESRAVAINQGTNLGGGTLEIKGGDDASKALTLTVRESLTASKVIMNDNATLNLFGTTAITVSSTVEGSGTLTNNTAVAVNFTGDVTAKNLIAGTGTVTLSGTNTNFTDTVTLGLNRTVVNKSADFTVGNLISFTDTNSGFVVEGTGNQTINAKMNGTRGILHNKNQTGTVTVNGELSIGQIYAYANSNTKFTSDVSVNYATGYSGKIGNNAQVEFLGNLSGGNFEFSGATSTIRFSSTGNQTISNNLGFSNTTGYIENKNTGTVTYNGSINVSKMTVENGSKSVFNDNTNIRDSISLGSNTTELTIGNGKLLTATITGNGVLNLDSGSSYTGTATISTLKASGSGTNKVNNAITISSGTIIDNTILQLPNGTNLNALSMTGANATLKGTNFTATTISSDATNALIEGKITASGATTVSAGTLAFAGNDTSLQAISGAGTVFMSQTGTANIEGAVDATVNIGLGTVNFNHANLTKSINFVSAGTANITNATSLPEGIDFNNQAGTVNFSQAINLAKSVISTGANHGEGKGTVTFNNNLVAATNAHLGQDNAVLNTVNLNGANNTVQGIAADNINIAGTVNANGNIRGKVYLSTNDSALVIEDGYDLRSASNTAADIAVSTATANKGAVTFKGTSIVMGSIGANNAIDTIDINGNNTKTVYFEGVTNARQMQINNAGNIVFKSASNIATLAAGSGTVTLQEASLNATDITGTAKFNLYDGATLTASNSFNGSSVISRTSGTANTINSSFTILDLDIERGTLTNSATSSSVTNLNFKALAGQTATLGGTSEFTATNIGVTTGGTGTVNNKITAANVTIAADARLNINHASSSLGAVTFSSGASLNIASIGANLITGDVTGKNGTLILSGNGSKTLNGKIGADAANKLSNISITGAGDTIFNNEIHALQISLGSGNVTANHATFDSAIHFAGDQTVTFTNAREITGSVTTDQHGFGTLDFAKGFSKLTGDLGAGTKSIKQLKLNESAEITGNVVAAVETQVENHTLTIGGTFSTQAGDTLKFNVNSAADHGKIVVSGIVNIDADTKTIITIGAGSPLNHDQKITIIDGAAGSTVAKLNDKNLTSLNSALIHFEQDTSNTEDLVIIAKRKSLDFSDAEINRKAVGEILNSISSSGDADLQDLNTRLLAMPTMEQVLDTLHSMLPPVNGASISSMTNVSNSTGTIVNNRLATTRGQSGISSGNAYKPGMDHAHFWMQGFGSNAEQDQRDGILGYTADTYGVVAGVDNEATDKLRVGVAVAYANTNIDNKAVNLGNTEMDSYQASLYADYELGNNFLSGQLGYIRSQITTQRLNVGGIIGRTAKGEFASNQFIARGELGRDITATNSMTLTPSIFTNYNYIDFGSYTETGAGGLSLSNVESEALQMLEVGINVRSEWTLSDGGNGQIKPNIHGGFRYDFINDKTQTTSQLAGGGAAFKTVGFEPPQHTFNIGAGLSWHTGKNWEVTTNYDYELKEDYEAHSGFIRAGYRF